MHRTEKWPSLPGPIRCSLMKAGASIDRKTAATVPSDALESSWSGRRRVEHERRYLPRSLVALVSTLSVLYKTNIIIEQRSSC